MSEFSEPLVPDRWAVWLRRGKSVWRWLLLNAVACAIVWAFYTGKYFGGLVATLSWWIIARRLEKK